MKTFKLIACFSFAGLILFGCAASPNNSAERKPYSLEYSQAKSAVLVSKEPVSVSFVQSYQKGDSLVVWGRVQRNHRITSPGHLDLAICDQEGTLLVQEQQRISGLSSHRKGRLELPFRFRIALIPPEGATVHLRYHAPGSGEVEYSCQTI